MWCRSAFPRSARPISWFGSIRSVRSTFFFSSRSRSSPVGQRVNSSSMSRRVAPCVRTCVGYVATYVHDTGCRAWSHSADDGGSAATISCCPAPSCFTSTCSSKCPASYLSRSFTNHISILIWIKRENGRVGKNGREGKGEESLFKNAHNLLFFFALQ